MKIRIKWNENIRVLVGLEKNREKSKQLKQNESMSFFDSICTQLCLTHYQMTNSRLFQTKNFDENGRVIQTGRNHCGKRRNCSLRAISPFPTMFSRGLFPRGVKRCHCVRMG